jgi:glycine dehydrogenase subunit 1
MPYIPHTDDETQRMCEVVGVKHIDDLFDEIPEVLKKHSLKVPEGINEMSLMKTAEQLAAKNKNGICFMGAGSYEHHIPAAVWDLTSRGEFLTAYTPYQAEASQGTLQLLYEFQTMIAELTGREVANASLYDGASALAEAILMSARLQKKSPIRILLPTTVHPFYRETVKTITQHQQIELIEVPFHPQQGILSFDALAPYASESITALVIQQPNFFGCLEDVHGLTDWAHKHGMLTIACVNPTSLGLLTPPGEWGEQGADIVCGEGQPLGVPLASGGPYFGFISTRLDFVRQLPGRIVGRTVDSQGKTGFTLTLQAREQHIRREKATSNICTNQGLLVTAATIYMSLLGGEGLHEVALTCHQQTQQLFDSLTQLPGVKARFSAPFFHEAVLSFDEPIESILGELQKKGILGGYPLTQAYPSLGQSLLICATEMRTDKDIKRYAEVLQSCLVRGESCTSSA